MIFVFAVVVAFAAGGVLKGALILGERAVKQEINKEEHA